MLEANRFVTEEVNAMLEELGSKVRISAIAVDFKRTAWKVEGNEDLDSTFEKIFEKQDAIVLKVPNVSKSEAKFMYCSMFLDWMVTSGRKEDFEKYKPAIELWTNFYKALN